jgi:hypothetical protein
MQQILAIGKSIKIIRFLDPNLKLTPVSLNLEPLSTEQNALDDFKKISEKHLDLAWSNEEAGRKDLLSTQLRQLIGESPF